MYNNNGGDNMRSMTGYGRIEKIIDNYNYSVEIKSLNGKYMNLKTSLSGIFSSLELKVQELLKTFFSRGNVNIFIDIRFINADDFVELDSGLIKSYYAALTKIKEELSLEENITLDLLTKFRDVIKIKIDDEKAEEIWKGLTEVIKETAHKVIEFQENEGKNLKAVLNDYLDKLETYVSDIEKESFKIKDFYREKLKNDIKSILSPEIETDAGRLETEVAVIAQRADISEEIERLKIHISRFREVMNSKDEAVGQQLDFLAQEMHREFNTIGSKSKNIIITDGSVDGRIVVNKIKEQVQNIY